MITDLKMYNHHIEVAEVKDLQNQNGCGWPVWLRWELWI